MSYHLALVALVSAIWVAPAAAADHPVGNARLAMRRAPATMVLAIRDANVTLPVIGSPDDPTIAAATLEIFTVGGDATTVLPAGAQWRAIAAKRTRYKFRNPTAPAVSFVRSATMADGVAIKVVARGVALPEGSIGSAAVRLTFGDTRLCSVFAAGHVLRDDSVRFVARATGASALADCSDAALAAASCTESGPPVCGGNCLGNGVCGPDTFGGGDCLCIQPSSPCGETAPVCNGACAGGEECVSIAGDSPLTPECVCLPVGATPCGEPGIPVCGGDCPSGRVCGPIHQSPIGGGGVACACGDPGPCESGGLVCGNGFACAQVPPGDRQCLPIPCAGAYPMCGGNCGAGVCRALDVNGTFQQCICADAGGASCDSDCGGFLCDEGSVCRVTFGSETTCGCEPP